jgi:hypothetical protein
VTRQIPSYFLRPLGDARHRSSPQPQPLAHILKSRILGIDALKLAPCLRLAANLIIEHGTLKAKLAQQAVRAVLAAAQCHGEHVNRRISLTTARKRAAAVEEERGLDRGDVFNGGGQGDDPLKLCGGGLALADPAWGELVLREILEVGDFDGDGLPDALIAMDTGGNCCPQDFAVVSYRGGGFFATLGPPESMGWGGIDVIRGEDGLLIRSNHASSGVGNTKDREWQIDYRIREGRVTEVARRENFAELAADPVLTLEDLLGKREERMVFDLNADGLPDEVSCRFWDRWGVLSCTITAAGLGEVGTLACARIGILPTTQNGWHELTCGRRSVVAWSEGEYRVP